MNNLTFQVTFGALHERKAALQNKHSLIGKFLTVQYQSRFKDTLLPQFPSGKGVREGYLVEGSFVPYD